MQVYEAMITQSVRWDVFVYIILCAVNDHQILLPFMIVSQSASAGMRHSILHGKAENVIEAESKNLFATAAFAPVRVRARTS